MRWIVLGAALVGCTATPSTSDTDTGVALPDAPPSIPDAYPFSMRVVGADTDRPRCDDAVLDAILDELAGWASHGGCGTARGWWVADGGAHQVLWRTTLPALDRLDVGATWTLDLADETDDVVLTVVDGHDLPLSDYTCGYGGVGEATSAWTATSGQIEATIAWIADPHPSTSDRLMVLDLALRDVVVQDEAGTTSCTLPDLDVRHPGLGWFEG